MEIVVIALAVAAGVGTATFTTVVCSRLLARRERDRQLFRAYLDAPEEFEAWLVHGAMDQIKRRLSGFRGDDLAGHGPHADAR